MNEIVFLEPSKQEIYTTSKVISEMTNIGHRRIKDAIRKHFKEIEQFGLLGAYETESTGGRPEEIYKLNEAQATFLMTLLKNNPVTVSFKAELVRQFLLMRQELRKRESIQPERKAIRRTLTDSIKALPDSPHKHFKYKQYTDLAYKVAIGKTAKQIREERGANKKDTASEYMTADELEAVSKVENAISALMGLGMEYAEIKEKLSNSIVPHK